MLPASKPTHRARFHLLRCFWRLKRVRGTPKVLANRCMSTLLFHHLVTVRSFWVTVFALMSPGEVNCHQETHRGAEPWDSAAVWRLGEQTPATRRGRAPTP
jgi:hypothetical protein